MSFFLFHVGEYCKRVLSDMKLLSRYTMRGTGGPLDLTLAIEVQYLQGRNEKFGNVNPGYVVNIID